MSQRSRRQDSVPSPAELLGRLAPAHGAITGAMARVKISGPVYAALDGVGIAMGRLAEVLGHPGRFAALDHLPVARHPNPIAPPTREPPVLPSMPDREVYEIVQEDDGTYTVIYAATGTVVVLNGEPQKGLSVDEADDVADHLEAINRIITARGTGTLNS